MEVIEHIYPEQASQMLKIWQTWLKPGGKVLMTTPNYHSIWPVLEWIMDRFNLAPKIANDQHVAHYTPGRLVKFCRESGFEVLRGSSFSHLSP